MATLGPIFLLQNLIAFGGKMTTLGLLFQKNIYDINLAISHFGGGGGGRKRGSWGFFLKKNKYI